MADDRLILLVDRLLEKTEAGAQHWRQTPVENEYSTSFPKYSIVLGGGKQFYLRIHGPDGKFIDGIAEHDLAQTLLGGDDKLKRLYTLARRDALDVDKALDELLASIG